MGVVTAGGAGASLGRHDLDAGRRAAVGDAAFAAGHQLSAALRGRAHGQRTRAPLAARPRHARDETAEPTTLRELCLPTHPR